MLEKMADFWDEEIEAMLDALTSLIEPMLIVFLGVIVGGIVIAMFLPIFKLNEVVSTEQKLGRSLALVMGRGGSQDLPLFAFSETRIC